MSSNGPSTEEARELIAINKIYEGPSSIQYPTLGGALSLECRTQDGRERFSLDVTRGRIALKKVSHNLRVRTSVVLLRLDVGGAPHRNPDDQIIQCPHLHVYREGEGDSWAYLLDSLPDSMPAWVFTDLTDLPQTLRDFMRHSNVAKPPIVDPGLF